MNVNSLNSLYGAWFRMMLFDKLKKRSEDTKSDMAVLFLTVTFKRHEGAEDDGQAKLEAFSHLYNLICRALVGRNFHRERFKGDLPFAMAFLDCEGSRFRKNGLSFEGLHIHSVLIVPKTEIEAVKETASSLVGKSRDGRTAIDQIDIQQVAQDDLEGLDRVCSYSSKMLGPNHLQMKVGEDFRIYPLDAEFRAT